jgi:hypothetical protein
MYIEEMCVDEVKAIEGYWQFGTPPVNLGGLHEKVRSSGARR